VDCYGRNICDRMRLHILATGRSPKGSAYREEQGKHRGSN
jgi:hypothetical protein